MSRARYLHFQLTESCNLACPGCYLPERSGMGASAEEIETTIFKPLAEDGVRFVTLTGGEPLLHPEWREISAAAVRNFESVQLVCNGMLLDLDTYAELRTIGIQSIKVSLDGSDPKIHDKLRGRKGCFNQVTGNLRAIAALSAEERGEIDVGCICTVNPHNVHILLATAALVEEIGLDSMLFQPFHPYDMLYPVSGKPIERPEADEAYLATLDEQLVELRKLRKERPAFLDNTLTMLGRFTEFYTAPKGPAQECGADRFTFVNSIFEVRGCLFCEPLATLGGQSLSIVRKGDAWQGFDSFRKGCTRCLMGCQFVDEAADLAEKGFFLLAEDNFEEAREAFDSSLAMEYSVPAEHGIGLSYLRLGNFHEAKNRLASAILHRPRNRYILQDLGDSLLNIKEWGDLELCAQKLAQVSDGKALSARLRGLAFLRQEKFEEALPYLKTAMEEWPNEDAWQPFNYGLACLNTGRFEEAECAIRLAADMDPFPFFRYRLAMALQGLGRIDDAITECQRAIELDSGPEQFHQLLNELTS